MKKTFAILFIFCTSFLQAQIIYFESFDSNLGDWQNVNELGGANWHYYYNEYADNGMAYMSGFGDGLNSDWLISPAITIDNIANVQLSFETTTKWGDGTSNGLQVYVSDNYNSAVSINENNWQELTNKANLPDSYPEAWINEISGLVDLSGFAGKTIWLAFKYTCGATNIPTWEIDNVKVFVSPSAENYYNDINLSERGDLLKQSLHNLMKGHTVLSYEKAKDVLAQSDEDPLDNKNLMMVYTGRPVVKTTDYGMSANDLNREHVWPKSHGDFGTVGPGADVHNLKPADYSVNVARSNMDFDFSDSFHPEATECKIDDNSFEPRDAVKGDIARIVFYMAARYEGGNSEPDLEIVDYVGSSGATLGKFSTLLQWHKNDPVDDFERHRNDVIFWWQNNRNPFIDHPEFVEYIWGDIQSSAYNSRQSRIRIYPNPANSSVHVEGCNTRLEMYDAMGNKIKEFAVTKPRHTINVSNLSNGMYFIKSTNTENISIEKIIIRH